MENKPEKIVITKLKRACHEAKAAWWVLLLIIGYSLFAGYLLGSSCLLYSTVGIPCPVCGATRSVFALLNGNLTDSLRYHPLLIPGIFVFGLYAFFWLTKEKMPKYINTVLIIFVFFLVALYFTRMILLYPRETPMIFNQAALFPKTYNFVMSFFN